MEALGHSFEARRDRMDEMLRVLRDCWAGTPGAFDGRQVSIRERIRLFPTPSQTAGIPLLVGGMADVSLRRAAVLGDGWLAIAFVERLDVDALCEQVGRVRALRAQRGDAHFQLVLTLHADPRSAPQLPEAVAAVARLGFDETIVEVPWGQGVDRACEIFAACREAVRPVELAAGGTGR
jgi:hypothetical protein